MARGVIKVYKSYMFRSKDPVIDKMRTVVQEAARAEGVSEAKMWQLIHERGGPTAGTHRNWYRGSTKRPQFAAAQASLHTIGKTLEIVDMRRNGK